MGRILQTDGNHEITLKNITFINGNFDGDGGAVYANSDLIFDHCTFINNTAKSGGAIHTGHYPSASYPKIYNSYFENNTAKESGGALHSELEGFKIENSTFKNNVAEYKPTEYSSFSRLGGGAIYSKFWAIHSYIKNSNFINNTAYYLGGAVNVQSGANSQDAIDIINSNFTDNNAASNGALYLGTRFSKVDNCRFINNHANETAGAVGIYNILNSITNSYFENNSAERDGGAVFSFAPYYHINSIDNCDFVNNHAGTYGGAVNAISTDIANSRFTDNSADEYGGAVTAYGSNVQDSEFSNNNAPDGTVLVMNDGSDINYASSSQSNNGLNDGEVKTDYTDRGILSPNDNYPRNVIWSDLGYVGFCCEKFFSQPYSGIVDHSLNVIDNNINGKVVSEYLKILMFTYFNDYTDFNKYPFYDYVWEFTDYDFENSDLEVVQHVIDLYNSGFRVPTENALKVLDNGQLLRMDFLALDTADGEQDIFLFNWDIVRGDLKKETINDTVFIGEKIDFKINVTNIGDAKISNISVEDNDFSKELVYVGQTIVSGNWTYDSKEKVWRLDHLEQGDSAVLILTFKSYTNGTFYNKATLKTKENILKVTEETVNVYTPQLFTKKVSLNKTVFNGEITQFVISLNNTGDYALSEVFVEDIADNGLEYIDYINGSRDWTYKDGKFYLVGKLDPNEIANFTVLFKATKSGNFTNTATGDSKETNNHTWDDSVEVFSPKMEVKKITLNETVHVNDIVEFKIIVTNIGDCNLSDISIEEKAPEDLVYQGFESGYDKLSYNNGVFRYDKLSVGDSIEFTVFYKAVNDGNFTNMIIVKSNETKPQNASNTTEVIKENTTTTNTSENTNETSTEENNSTADEIISCNDESGEDTLDKSYDGRSKNIAKSTGNPLAVLLLVLLVLGLNSARRKK